MRKVIGIVLIVISLAVGYLGFTKLQDSRASLEVLGIEITAEDKDSSREAYVLLGIGVVCLVGGVVLLRPGKK